MRNKKLLFIFVVLLIMCVATLTLAACNKNDDTPPTDSDFSEGDVVIDKEDVTITEKEYDNAGNELREISRVETTYNVTYLSNDASVIYLKGNKPNEMFVTGFDGVPTSLVVKDLESKINLGGSNIVVKGITEGAFYGCETLTTVDLEKERVNSLTFAIGDYAFSNCPNLTQVTLPTKTYMASSSIGEYAFADCESLTTVTVPNRFKYLGAYAFADCVNLKSVTLTDGVPKIPRSFLNGCESLANISIPASVNYVGSKAFNGCKALTSITFPDSVTYIGTEALANCISLQSVKVPFIGTSYELSGATAFADLFATASNANDSINPETEQPYLYSTRTLNGQRFVPYSLTSVEVTNASDIPSYAFMGLDSLTSLKIKYTTATRLRVYGEETGYTNYDIPEIETVGAYAFAGIKGISMFDVPSSVTHIGGYAFANSGLDNDGLIAHLNGINHIDNYAFSNLDNVTTVSVPQDVVYVSNGAFANNKNLTSFTVNSANTALSGGIVSGCRQLETVNINYIGTATIFADENNSIYASTNNDPFALIFSSATPSDMYDESGSYHNAPYYYSANGYYLPKTLDTINVNAARTIPENAFNGVLASNINITYDEQYDTTYIWRDSIGTSAFYGCKNIDSFAIDSSISTIGQSAFAYSGISRVTIPSNVQTIGENAFAYCEQLTSFVVSEGNNDIAIYGGTLAGCSNLATIKVPYIGSGYKNNLETVHLNNNAFAALFSTSYPTNMFSEDDLNQTNARFYYANGYYVPASLDEIKITAATTIPDYAFTGILASEIDVTYRPYSDVTSRYVIGERAFSGCRNLSSFTFDSEIKKVSRYAFANSGLIELYLPASVSNIAEYAFLNCNNIPIVLYGGTETDYTSALDSNAGLSDKDVICNFENKVVSYTFVSPGGKQIKNAKYITEFPTVTLKDSVFYGWYDNSEYTGEPVSTPYYNANGATLYAKFLSTDEYNALPDYTYTFSSQGTIVDSLTTTGKYLQELPEITRTGYDFAGWYDNSNCYGSPVSVPYHTGGNATLYAKWTADTTDESHQGTNFDDAITVLVGQPYDVRITTIGQRVYFAFTPTETRSYSIEASNTTGDNYGYLFDSTRNQLASDDDGGSESRCFKITYTLYAGQTYYIVAAMYSDNSTGSYQIKIS